MGNTGIVFHWISEAYDLRDVCMLALWKSNGFQQLDLPHTPITKIFLLGCFNGAKTNFFFLFFFGYSVQDHDQGTIDVLQKDLIKIQEIGNRNPNPDISCET